MAHTISRRDVQLADLCLDQGFVVTIPDAADEEQDLDGLYWTKEEEESYTAFWEACYMGNILGGVL